MMAQLGVERTVRRLDRWHEDQHTAARHHDIAKRPERPGIVRDVFEHIHADHGVKAVAGQFGPVAFLEMAHLQHEAWLLPHHFLYAARAIEVGFYADDEIRHLGQRTTHRADPRPDFEDARSDMGTKEIEYVRAVPPRLLHRLEIVSGVLLQCLAVPAVRVRHSNLVYWRRRASECRANPGSGIRDSGFELESRVPRSESRVPSSESRVLNPFEGWLWVVLYPSGRASSGTKTLDAARGELSDLYDRYGVAGARCAAAARNGRRQRRRRSTLH